MKLEPGTNIRASFMVKKLDPRTSTNGKEYLSGEVFDASGPVPAVIWHLPTIRKEPCPGDVLEAKWKVSEFNGKAQLDVLELYAHTKSEHVEDASAFIRTSSITKPVWLAYYNAEVRPLIEDPCLERLIDHVLEETPFFRAPAAKSMHQNWRGGLAEHTHRLLRLFVGLTKSGHPTVDASRKGLVIAGLVLHDYAKAYEYEETAPGQFDVGSWGSLLGHLAGGPLLLMSTIAQHPELQGPPELLNHLMHVLLAHHGQVDWGSPVVPATREALIVHYLDNLDGKLSNLEEAKPDAKSYGLGTRPQTYVPEGDQ